MKRALLASVFTIIGVGCLCVSVYGSEVEKQLKSDYVGKTLTLRHFYHGGYLKFHSDGTLQGDALLGPWTLDGQIAVEQIHFKPGMLEIDGRRVTIVFDSKQKPVDQIAALSQYSGKQRKELEKGFRQQRVRVEIELPATASPDEVGLAIHKVFLMVGESMIDIAPPLWRSYFAGLEGKQADPPEPAGERIYRVVSAKPGGITPPHAIHSPDPEYTDEARKAKYQGTAFFWLVIMPNGETKDIRVVRPLGFGLDEKALSAISTWTFEPAMKDGQPVAVMVNVEVSFRLY